MHDTKGNECLFINSFLPEKSKFNLFVLWSSHGSHPITYLNTASSGNLLFTLANIY